MGSEKLVLKVGLPWDGRSPRTLTKAYARFSLASEGTGRVNEDEPSVIQKPLKEGPSNGL